MNHWQTKSSDIKYDNPWMTVCEDQVIKPNGSDGIYGVVHFKSPAVFVVPVDADGNTYLVLQERYAVGEESWEIPAGATDGQPYDVAAKRELLEEAGVTAQTITKIIESRTMNGCTDHLAIICLATNIEKVTERLDEDDGILEARKVPLTDVRDMILRGEIKDGFTIQAVLAALVYIEKETA